MKKAIKEALNSLRGILSVSFENIVVSKRGVEFDLFKNYSQEPQHVTLKGNELSLFNLHQAAGNGLLHAFYHGLAEGIEPTLGDIQKGSYLSYERENKATTDVFKFMETLTEDETKLVLAQAKELNDKYLGGQSMRDFVISDGTINEGDTLLISSKDLGAQFVHVLYAPVGAMITCISDKGRGGILSLTSGLNVEVVEEIPTAERERLDEAVSIWNDRIEKHKLEIVESNAKAQVRAEEKAVRDAEKAAKAEAMQVEIDANETLLDEMLQEVEANEAPSKEALKAVTEAVKGKKISKEFRTTLRERVAGVREVIKTQSDAAKEAAKVAKAEAKAAKEAEKVAAKEAKEAEKESK